MLLKNHLLIVNKKPCRGWEDFQQRGVQASVHLDGRWSCCWVALALKIHTTYEDIFIFHSERFNRAIRVRHWSFEIGDFTVFEGNEAPPNLLVLVNSQLNEISS